MLCVPEDSTWAPSTLIGPLRRPPTACALAEGLTRRAGTASLGCLPSSPHPRTAVQAAAGAGVSDPSLGDPNSSAATPSVRVSRCNKEQRQGESKMDGTRQHVPNGPHASNQGLHDEHTAPTEAEVQTIVQSIKDASSATSAATTSLPSLPSSELLGPQDPTPSQTPRPGEFDVGEYWDLASMAPLNQVSRVSI